MRQVFWSRFDTKQVRQSALSICEAGNSGGNLGMNQLGHGTEKVTRRPPTPNWKKLLSRVVYVNRQSDSLSECSQ